jgi:hypothetical protein
MHAAVIAAINILVIRELQIRRKRDARRILALPQHALVRYLRQERKKYARRKGVSS